MAWEYFHPMTTFPTLIHYVKDRDLWQWKLYESRIISALISSFPHVFKEWSTLSDSLNNNLRECITLGQPIIRTQEKIVDGLVSRNSYWTGLYGPYDDITGEQVEYSVPTVNSPVFQSEIGEKLLEVYPQAPFAMISYNFQQEERVSLRSRGDFDVSEVAKVYGGGGHKAAAGFNLEIRVE